MLIVWLAWRDLLKNRFFLFCNAATLVGVLLPFLVLLGVKNGVYSALIGELLSDPSARQIDTSGNNSFTQAELEPIHAWPEVVFVTPKARSQFDFIDVRKKGGIRSVTALAVPSGDGDPNLPRDVRLGPAAFALSAKLANRLEVAAGDTILLVTQAEDRPRQLVLEATVSGVLTPLATAGDAILVPYAILDQIEAFYDAYSLPDHGIVGERPLLERATVYEGVRLYVSNLEDLGELHTRLEQQLDVRAISKVSEVQGTLRLGRNLNLALSLVAGCAVLGFGAALAIGFWAEARRKANTLATFALMGIPATTLSLFPVVQAIIATSLGVMLSFGLFVGAAAIAQSMFGGGITGDAPIAFIPLEQALFVALCVLGLALLVSLLAAWAVQRLDPASVMRTTS